MKRNITKRVKIYGIYYTDQIAKTGPGEARIRNTGKDGGEKNVISGQQCNGNKLIRTQ